MRIAVLVTYHNEASLLTECLQSLCDADSLPDEIIVYDDASAVPPEPYIPDNLRVRVIKGRENHGPAYGRNVLLQASSCEYVNFHDADDLVASAWCDQVRARLDAVRPDVLFTEAASFCNGDLVQERVIGLQSLTEDRDLVRFCIRGAILPGAAIYQRERALEVGGYSTEYWQSEDYDFHIRLAHSGVNYDVICQPLLRIRMHEGNRSKDTVRVWVDAVRCLDELSGELGPGYAQDICDAVAKAGRTLYQAGALSEAEEAFRVAYRLGLPRFSEQTIWYRLLAQCGGPILAERVGRAYRKILPTAIRRSMQVGRQDIA